MQFKIQWVLFCETNILKEQNVFVRILVNNFFKTLAYKLKIKKNETNSIIIDILVDF